MFLCQHTILQRKQEKSVFFDNIIPKGSGRLVESVGRSVESVGPTLSVGRVGINDVETLVAQHNSPTFSYVLPIFFVRKVSKITCTFLCQHTILQRKQENSTLFDNIIPKGSDRLVESVGRLVESVGRSVESVGSTLLVGRVGINGVETLVT